MAATIKNTGNQAKPEIGMAEAGGKLAIKPPVRRFSTGRATNELADAARHAK